MGWWSASTARRSNQPSAFHRQSLNNMLAQLASPSCNVTPQLKNRGCGGDSALPVMAGFVQARAPFDHHRQTPSPNAKSLAAGGSLLGQPHAPPHFRPEDRYICQSLEKSHCQAASRRSRKHQTGRSSRECADSGRIPNGATDSKRAVFSQLCSQGDSIVLNSERFLTLPPRRDGRELNKGNGRRPSARPS